MKIGVDTFGCECGKNEAGEFIKSLLRALKNVQIPDGEKLELELFGEESERYDYVPDEDSIGNAKISFEEVLLPKSTFGIELWHSFLCVSFFKKRGYDAVIFPCPHKFSPLKSKIPAILIISEMVSKKIESFSIFSKKRFLISLKNAKIIAVSSQFLKKDLKNLSIPQEKIRVVRPGIDHAHFYPREKTSVSNADSGIIFVQKPYFVYNSDMTSAEKNHCKLIRAFGAFKSRTEKPHRLVLIGGGELAEKVSEEVAINPFSEDIFMTGAIARENVPELYANAEGFVCPSAVEGSGNSVLEAMSCGIPVLCAKSGALPEMSGENALYFDESDEDSLSLSLSKLASLDEDEREKLISDGLSWSSRFSWENCANELFGSIWEVVFEKNTKKRRKIKKKK